MYQSSFSWCLRCPSVQRCKGNQTDLLTTSGKMAASMERFESWLTEKLLSVNPDTDTDVFVSYIAGILEEESPEAEKKESILDLLGQVVVINFFLVYKYWLFKNRIHLPLKND